MEKPQKSELYLFTENITNKINNMTLSFDSMSEKELEKYLLGLVMCFPQKT